VSRSIVVDLTLAVAPSMLAVSLLGAARRYVRSRRADLVLAAVPSRFVTLLERADVLPLYVLVPSVADALPRGARGPRTVTSSP